MKLKGIVVWILSFLVFVMILGLVIFGDTTSEELVKLIAIGETLILSGIFANLVRKWIFEDEKKPGGKNVVNIINPKPKEPETIETPGGKTLVYDDIDGTFISNDNY